MKNFLFQGHRNVWRRNKNAGERSNVELERRTWTSLLFEQIDRAKIFLFRLSRFNMFFLIKRELWRETKWFFGNVRSPEFLTSSERRKTTKLDRMLIFSSRSADTKRFFSEDLIKNLENHVKKDEQISTAKNDLSPSGNWRFYPTISSAALSLSYRHSRKRGESKRSGQNFLPSFVARSEKRTDISDSSVLIDFLNTNEHRIIWETSIIIWKKSTQYWVCKCESLRGSIYSHFRNNMKYWWRQCVKY